MQQPRLSQPAPRAALAALAALPAAPALPGAPPPLTHAPRQPQQSGRHRARFERSGETEQSPPATSRGATGNSLSLEQILHKSGGTLSDSARTASLATSDKLERQLARRGQSDQCCDLEIAKNLDAIGHLTEELDGLFAVMGRLTVTARVGQRCALQLASGTPRTVEVKLPKAQEETRDLAVHIDCTYDGKFHQPEPGPHRQSMLPEFDLCVSDTQRQASAGGPYRAQSARKSTHRLQVLTDFGSIFVTLCAKKECHVELFCRASSGANIADAASSDGSEDSDSDKHRSTGVSKGLQAKLQLRRQELVGAASAKPSTGGAGAAAAGSSAGTCAASRVGLRGRSFGDFVFQGSKAPRSPQEEQEAQQRVFQLWFGPSSPWNPKPFYRAKGQWVKLLSSECPRKLLRWLRREAQERRCLHTVAVVGAFAFFLKRQRELHAMRARTALRQLMWYKALFAASRFRMAVVFAARGREEKREAASGKKRGQQVPGRRSQDSAMPLVERVRRYADSFGSPIGVQGPPAVAAQSPSGAGPPALPPAKPHGLEQHLAAQGFTLHPRPAGAGSFGAVMSGDHGHHHVSDRRSLGAKRNTFLRDLSECLGRQVRADPSGLGAAVAAAVASAEGSGAHEGVEQKAMEEVSSRMLQVTVKHRELKSIEEASAPKVKLMGTQGFKRYSQRISSNVAHDLLKKKAEQAEVDMGCTSGGPKITKRYLLKFFDDEPRDMPWLPMLQSLLLVIQGRAAFQTASERHAVDENLRFFKEARRQALRKPGAFAPLEACLWSHPVILQLAMRLQRSMLHGDSATAWKGSVFEGSYKGCSGRDHTGMCLHTAMPVGSRAQLVLRRLVDVAGQFELGTGRTEVHSVDCTPDHQGCIATKTASGHPIRAFGDKEGLDVHTVINRKSDLAKQMPPDAGEQAQRLEALRLQRREKEFSSWDSNKSRELLLADSELKAQQRYGHWMMRTEVPDDARTFKANFQPYFESFASRDQLTSCSSSSRGPRVLHGKSLDLEDSTQASMAFSSSAAGVATPGGGGDALQGASQGHLPDIGGSPLPQSVEEVGQLVERSDALRTILGMDKAEHGGFAHRCPAGWNSGYREEPMSKEEIRRARIVEKCLAPRRLPCGAPHTVR